MYRFKTMDKHKLKKNVEDLGRFLGEGIHSSIKNITKSVSRYRMGLYLDFLSYEKYLRKLVQVEKHLAKLRRIKQHEPQTNNIFD